MDTIAQLDEILPQITDVVRGVRPDQMDDPTPCSDFTVRDLFNHMIGGAGQFAPQLRGEAAPAPPGEDDDLTGDDPVATFDQAVRDLLDALHAPGALDRTVSLPFGDIPGDMLARFLTVDGMVHAWDLARATGQRFDPPEELVREVHATARMVIAPQMRDGDTFGTEVEVPDGAPELDRLIAFTGRRP